MENYLIKKHLLSKELIDSKVTTTGERWVSSHACSLCTEYMMKGYSLSNGEIAVDSRLSVN